MPPLDIPYNCLLTGYMDARAGVHSRYALFDKLVPGYYHRRSEQGELCTSACCNNTAPEHAMLERLIIEDALHWVRQYKVCYNPYFLPWLYGQRLSSQSDQVHVCHPQRVFR